MDPVSETPLHVFLVAGEESGDRLGGALMRALREATGGAVRFSGVGGRDMTEAGLRSLFPLGDLAIVGITSIPRRLPQLLRRIRETADAAIAAQPDVLVIIDSPEFTHRVARRVRAKAPEMLIVDYVCPSVWAWRPWRARAMRRYVDHVLALLPFEPKALRELGGPPASFVGHPIADRVAEIRPDATEATRREAPPPVLLVMPGSRSGELNFMLPVFGETVTRLQRSIPDIDVAVLAVPHLARRVRAAVATWPVPVRVLVEPGERNEAMRTARAALVKSGTGTLELAVAGVPMVAAYKVGRVEEMVARLLIRTSSFILANLVLGERAVPELLQGDCTSDKLAAALLPLLRETPDRQAQLAAFARLDTIMQIGTLSPSRSAAARVLALAKAHQPR
ncbi:MAG: lipid-A-disaccharide synthase [Pseudolabrys sp.]|nr:lipid-A-disaccharide synthase [Pseudolabrys sp.]